MARPGQRAKIADADANDSKNGEDGFGVPLHAAKTANDQRNSANDESRCRQIELPAPSWIFIGWEEREPAAEEEQRREARYSDHVRVFGHEKHRELEGRVLGVEAGDKFCFRFGQIKGNAVGFRDGRSQIADESEKLRNDLPA